MTGVKPRTGGVVTDHSALPTEPQPLPKCNLLYKVKLCIRKYLIEKQRKGKEIKTDCTHRQKTSVTRWCNKK